MIARLVTVAALSGAVALTLSPASPAHAYCRATTEDIVSECECTDEGLPLYWDRGTISYAINERGFPGLREDTVREVIADSFAHWTEVLCDDEPVELSVEQLAATTPMLKEHVPGTKTLNVFVHLSGEEFIAAGGDSTAYALTSTFMNMNTGEIMGTDITFNEDLGPFAVCPAAGCSKGTDLENVVTHEVGHLFGLGHSDDEESTMGCRAPHGETRKRTLEADDEQGICSIYAPPVVQERAAALRGTKPRGCQLARANTPSWCTLALPILALLALCSRRTRARMRA